MIYERLDNTNLTMCKISRYTLQVSSTCVTRANNVGRACPSTWPLIRLLKASVRPKKRSWHTSIYSQLIRHRMKTNFNSMTTISLLLVSNYVTHSNKKNWSLRNLSSNGIPWRHKASVRGNRNHLSTSLPRFDYPIHLASLRLHSDLTHHAFIQKFPLNAAKSKF